MTEKIETTELSLRRKPQQHRGQLRFNKLLDAAEQLFAENGYDNATTNAIAARAQTSIGSLYQFFPNKEAILKAVALRYLEEMRALFDQTLNPQATQQLPLEAFLERLIMGMAHLRESHAGFRVLFFAAQSSPEVASATAAMQNEIMGRIDTLLAHYMPTLSPQKRDICKRTSVTIFQSLMVQAMDLQGNARKLQLEEMRIVLLTYLQCYIDTEDR